MVNVSQGLTVKGGGLGTQVNGCKEAVGAQVQGLNHEGGSGSRPEP